MERRKLKNHLELFPKEIWEMTLEQMEDSKDILGLLRAIPKLDISIKSRKKYWLIDQIIPFLLNILDKKDILNLRLVCKEWQRRLDFFLPNQPYYRAYSDDLHKDNEEFWGFLDGSKYNTTTTFYDCLLDLTTTNPANYITKIDKILDHSRPCNPFMFRKLCVNTYGRHDNKYALNLTKLFSFLERFGAHVWYLNLYLAYGVSTVEIDLLIRMLRLVGNLKSLQLFLSRPWARDKSQPDRKLFERSLPELPFFETLKICNTDGEDSTKELMGVLLRRYGPQIRRLFLPEDLWSVEFKEVFPQLTELEFPTAYHEYYTKACDIVEVSAYKTLLDSICSPLLVKLQLCFYSSNVTLNIEDVLKWLKRFPQIKYFEINSRPHQDKMVARERLILKETGTSDPTKDSIPSLQILKIAEGHGLSYKFLRCFPYIRELELRPYCWPTVNALTESNDSFNLREQIQTGKIYESNIWELMPKLRKICLFPPQDEYEYHWRSWSFTRDIFEKLKKAGMIPTEPQLHSFRQDIQNFMEDFAEAESESDSPDRSRSSDYEDSE